MEIGKIHILIKRKIVLALIGSNQRTSQARSHQYGLAARAVPLFETICTEIRCVPYHYFSGKSAVLYHSKIRGCGPVTSKNVNCKLLVEANHS